MKLSLKHFKVRTILLSGPIVISFFAFLFYLVISDYLIPEEKLNKARLIISEIQFNIYTKKGILKSNKTHKCLDIHTKDNQYVIRLSDKLYSDIWQSIQKTYSEGDTMDILYINHLLQDSILYNPNELKIRNSKIIEYKDTKTMNLLVLLLVTSANLIFCFVYFAAITTYRKELLQDDKLTYHASKWKLIKIWFGLSDS